MTKYGIFSSIFLANPQPAGERKGKPWLLPFVFAIIAVVFLILALFGPWGAMSGEGEIAGEGYTFAYGYGLQSYTATADEKILPEPGSDPYNATLTDEFTVNYNDKPEDGGLNDDVDKGGGPNELGAWNTCFYLAILASIMAILMLVFTLVAGTKRSAKMGKLAMIFAILASVFGLLAPIYAATGIPAGVEADYDERYKDWDDTYGEKPDLHNSWWDSWDEESVYSKAEITVGAGWGFYLSLIGGILALLGGIFIMKMNKKLKEESPAAPPPPAPAPPPPQQPPQ